MASESRDTVSVTLPDELGSWLEERAEGADLSREELLRQLVSAYRVTTEEDAPLEDGVAEIVDARVSGLESDVDDKFENVRKRVLQIKREVDGKAAADHDHPELERVDAVDRRLESIVSDLEAVTDDVAELEDRVDGQEAALDDVRDKLTRVASAVIRLRDGENDGRLTALRRAAARNGVNEADCDACEGSVHVALLSEAICPHCGIELADVEPAKGFFSSPRLVPGDAAGGSSATEGSE